MPIDTVMPFIGPIDLAPAKAQRVLGSLVPMEKDAVVTVLFVPAGAVWNGETIALENADTHLLLLAEAGTQVTATIRLHGNGERRHRTEIIVKDGANCDLTIMQECDGDSQLTVHEKATIGRSARLLWKTRAFGASNIDHTLRSSVTGEDARSDVLWTCMTSGKQQRIIRAENTFEAPRGSGEMTLKGIAEEHAFLQVRGNIIIGGQGGGTDTFLRQDILMLDPTAKVDAVPALQIKTNDVKASHAASIRRITPEDLFTFGARGITESLARTMLIRGFLGMAEPSTYEIQ